MCEHIAVGWVCRDEELASRLALQILRHSTVHRHCGLMMAVTESFLICRNPRCRVTRPREEEPTMSTPPLTLRAAMQQTRQNQKAQGIVRETMRAHLTREVHREAWRTGSYALLLLTLLSGPVLVGRWLGWPALVVGTIWSLWAVGVMWTLTSLIYSALSLKEWRTSLWYHRDEPRDAG